MKDGVAGTMVEGDYELRPWEGEARQVGGWAGSLNPVSQHSDPAPSARNQALGSSHSPS